MYHVHHSVFRLQDLQQHRQRLHKRGTKTKTTEKPLEIGTFVIGKEYLNEYKKYDSNMKKVNKWKDIVIKITV